MNATTHTEGWVYIQCTAPNGEVGDYMLNQFGDLISPVFCCLPELYRWLRANGWVQGPFDPSHLAGVYWKEKTK